MSVPKVIDNVIGYVSVAVSRIFGLDDDNYPNTGVQPFTGEPHKKIKHDSDW
jgi:hypothetical protein